MNKELEIEHNSRVASISGGVELAVLLLPLAALITFPSIKFFTPQEIGETREGQSSRMQSCISLLIFEEPWLTTRR